MEITQNSVLYLDSFCYTCSNQNVELYNVNILDDDEITFQKKLYSCFPDLESSDGDSNIQRYICKGCMDILNMVYEFRKIFVRSIKFTQKYKADVKKCPEDITTDYSSYDESTPENSLKISCTGSFENEEFYQEFLETHDSAKEQPGNCFDDSIEIFETKLEPLEIDDVFEKYCYNCESTNCTCNGEEPFLGFEKIIEYCASCDYLRVDDDIHTRKEFICDICGRIYKSISGLCKHKTIHQEIKSCTICSKTFSHLESLKKHMKSHPNAKISWIKCKFCNKLLRSKKGLSLHMRIHKKTDTNCQYCGTSLENGSDHICKKVGKCFECNQSIDKDKIHHCIKFTCFLCPTEFKNTKSFRAHLKRHVLNKSSNCQNCSSKFPNKRELNKHLKQHVIIENSKTDFGGFPGMN